MLAMEAEGLGCSMDIPSMSCSITSTSHAVARSASTESHTASSHAIELRMLPQVVGELVMDPMRVMS